MSADRPDEAGGEETKRARGWMDVVVSGAASASVHRPQGWAAMQRAGRWQEPKNSKSVRLYPSRSPGSCRSPRAGIRDCRSLAGASLATGRRRRRGSASGTGRCVHARAAGAYSRYSCLRLVRSARIVERAAAPSVPILFELCVCGERTKQRGRTGERHTSHGRLHFG